jgi:hypothetical protein
VGNSYGSEKIERSEEMCFLGTRTIGECLLIRLINGAAENLSD